MEPITKTRFALNTKGNCFLCLQHYQATEHNVEESPTFSFKFLSKYLNLDVRKVFNFSAGLVQSKVLENAEIIVEVCRDCAVFAEQFVDLYEQWDLIKLRLNNCVKNIHDVMVDAEKNTDGLTKYRERIMETINPVDIVMAGMVENLRKETISKSARHRITYSETSEQSQNTPEQPFISENFVCDNMVQVPPDNEFLSASASKENVDNKENKSSTSAPEADHNYTISVKPGNPPVFVKNSFKSLGNKRYECNQCGKIVSGKSRLNHSTEQNHKCAHCPLILNSTGCLRNHELIVHKDVLFQDFKDSRLSPDEFKKVITKIFDTFSYQKTDNRFTCSFCSEQGFFNKTNVTLHMIQKHFDQFIPILRKNQLLHLTGSSNSNNVTATETSLRCRHCNLPFTENKSLILHMLESHRSSLFSEFKAPVESDKNFEDRINKEIQTFVRNQAPLSNKCQVCRKTFQNLEHLQIHVVRSHYADVARKLVSGKESLSEGIKKLSIDDKEPRNQDNEDGSDNEKLTNQIESVEEVENQLSSSSTDHKAIPCKAEQPKAVRAITIDNFLFDVMMIEEEDEK